jgi:hypothetical protein
METPYSHGKNFPHQPPLSAHTKSKLIAYRQCPKRLWLEIHHPELRADNASTQAVFATVHKVGELAQSILTLLALVLWWICKRWAWRVLWLKRSRWFWQLTRSL